MRFELHKVLTATEMDLFELPDSPSSVHGFVFDQDCDTAIGFYTADPKQLKVEGDNLRCEYGQELDPSKMEIGRKYPAFDVDGSTCTWNESNPDQWLVRVE